MRSLVYLIFLCPLLVACSDPKQALDTWVHADAGSYGAAISPDLKLDPNAKTLIFPGLKPRGQTKNFAENFLLAR